MLKSQKPFRKYIFNEWSKHLTSIYEKAKIKDKLQKAIEISIRQIIGNKKFERVLDVSSGLGYIDYIFSDNISNLCCVDVCDYVDRDILSHTVRSFEFKKYNAINIPYDDGYFDLVWHFDVLEHVENDTEFLKENMRVLHENGILIFGTPNLSRLANILKKLFLKLQFPMYLGTDEYGNCIHLREYSYDMLIKLCQKAMISNYKIIPSYIGFPTVRYFGSYIGAGFIKVPNLLKKICSYWLVACRK